MFLPCICTFHISYIAFCKAWPAALSLTPDGYGIDFTERDVPDVECATTWWEHLSWGWDVMSGFWWGGKVRNISKYI